MSLPVRVILVAVAWEVYAALFLRLYSAESQGVAAVAALPVTITAALFGTRIGLLTALASVPAGILLAEASGAGAPPYVDVGWGMGTVILHGIAALVGIMRAMNVRLKRELARRNATLRFARVAAAETNPDRLLSAMLDEASSLLGAEGGVVRRWDEAAQLLLPVQVTSVQRPLRPALCLGEGMSGRAAAQRKPVVVSDYQNEFGATSRLGRGGLRAGVSVPLLHEGRLLGTVSLHDPHGVHTFLPEDVEVLEVLASTAAAALVGLEITRLEGALLAVRTAQHGIRNALSAAVACAEIVADDPTLSSDLRRLGEEAVRGTRRANEELERLGQISRIEEQDWGPNSQTTIDLERSALTR
jgi:hypothetical protein